MLLKHHSLLYSDLDPFYVETMCNGAGSSFEELDLFLFKASVYVLVHTWCAEVVDQLFMLQSSWDTRYERGLKSF